MYVFVMFKIKDCHKNIYIDGNLVVESNKPVSYVDMVSYSEDKKGLYEYIDLKKNYNEKGESIFYIDNDFVWEDNAIYHAKKEISFNNINVHVRNPYNCIYSYKNNLAQVYDIFELHVDGLKRRTLNRMLYLTIMSIYELFMADLAVTCYLRFDELKNYHIKNIQHLGKDLEEKDIPEKIKKKHFSKFTSKNNEWSVQKHFKEYFNIDIPVFDLLNDAFSKRDDIAHRFHQTIDNDYIIVEDKEIYELVDIINTFVYELFVKVKNSVYKY